MRKFLVVFVVEIMIAVGGFLTEYFWPAGDPRWAYVLLAGAIVIPLLYSPEIWGFIRRQATKTREADTEVEPLPLPPVIPEPRVVTTVDPGESQVSQGKGYPLIVPVCITVENGLDVVAPL